MSSLEERARSATNALLVQVEGATVTTLTSRRPRRRSARVLVTTAVVAFAIFSVVLARQVRTNKTSVDVRGAPSSSTFESGGPSPASNVLPPGTVASQSRTFGGTSYVVYVTNDASIGIEFVAPNGTPLGEGATDWSSESPTVDTPFAHAYRFNERFVVFYGRAPTSVARVRLNLGTGDTVEGPVDAVTGQPFALFAVGLEAHDPAELKPVIGGTAIFLAADGSEISRQLIAVDHD